MKQTPPWTGLSRSTAATAGGASAHPCPSRLTGPARASTTGTASAAHAVRPAAALASEEEIKPSTSPNDAETLPSPNSPHRATPASPQPPSPAT